MLIVLDHPEIPLHNNLAELGARKAQQLNLGTSWNPP